MHRHGILEGWREERTTTSNYEQLRLLHDPNAAFGRNASADVLGSRAEALQMQEELQPDDEGPACSRTTGAACTASLTAW